MSIERDRDYEIAQEIKDYDLPEYMPHLAEIYCLIRKMKPKEKKKFRALVEELQEQHYGYDFKNGKFLD